jgi:peptidylprolyl isomerase
MACAGAETAADDAPALTLADVTASPDAWRTVAPENLVVFNTSKGRILIELLPEVAPNHDKHFRHYVQTGLYDGTVFHRVIKGFMAQGGDVEQTHGADKMLPPIDAEFTFRRDPAVMPLDSVGPADSAKAGFYNGIPINTVASFMAGLNMDGKVESWIPHCPGVLSSARTTDPNSANAQFFLISDEGQHLDKDYTAKGRVVVGLDIVKTIKLGPAPNGSPIANPDVLVSAKLVSDMPQADRPVVHVQRMDTPEWQARLAAADKARTEICDIPQVAAVVE